MEAYFAEQDQQLRSLINDQYETILSSNERLPEVQNVVVTFSLGAKIFPKRLAANGLNSDYKPGKFAASITRIRPPQTTALQFKTGRIVIVGAKSKTQARCAKQFYRKLINCMGYATNMSPMELHNKVCNVNVGYPIDVARLRQERRIQSTFEPETFPGLIYSHPVSDHRMVIVLLFDTGGAIMMGLRHDNEEFEVWGQISGILREYRDDSISRDSHNRYVSRLQKKINAELKKRDLTYTKVGSMRDAKEVLREMTNEALRELMLEEIGVALSRLYEGKSALKGRDPKKDAQLQMSIAAKREQFAKTKSENRKALLIKQIQKLEGEYAHPLDSRSQDERAYLKQLYEEAHDIAVKVYKMNPQFRALYNDTLQESICDLLKRTQRYDVKYVTDEANYVHVDELIARCLVEEHSMIMGAARDKARVRNDETLWNFLQETLLSCVDEGSPQNTNDAKAKKTVEEKEAEAKSAAAEKAAYQRKVKKAGGVLLPDLSGEQCNIPEMIHINQIMILLSNFFRDCGYWRVDLMFYKNIESELVSVLCRILKDDVSAGGGEAGGKGARLNSFVQDIVMAAHPSESFDFQETCAKEVSARYSDFVDRWFVLNGKPNTSGSKSKRQPRKKAAVKKNAESKKRTTQLTQLKISDLFSDACREAATSRLSKKRKLSDEERANEESEAKRAKTSDEQEEERKRDEAQRAEDYEKQEREEKEYQKQLQISLKYGFKPQPRKKRAAILLDQQPEKYRYDTAHL